MMNNKIRYAKYAAALAASTAMMSSASAATITWGTFDADAIASEVSTTGTLVTAVDFVSDASLATGVTTVNGVDFTRTSLGNTYAPLNFNIATGDTDFDALYASGVYDRGPITLTGLTVGAEYQVQVFYGDNRGGVNSARTFVVGDGTTVTTAPANSTGGEWVIGTFTADATGTQVFNGSFNGTAAQQGNSNFNAYQLRAIPEPSSTASLGLGGIALILRRRK